MKKLITSIVLILLILGSFVSQASAVELYPFLITLDRNGFTVPASLPQKIDAFGTGSYSQGVFVLIDIDSQTKNDLYNANPNAHWVIVKPYSSVAIAEYDFTSSLDENLRGNLSSDEFASMYMTVGNFGITFRLERGAPNPAYDPRLHKDLLIAFSTEELGGLSNTLQDFIVPAKLEGSGAWVIPSSYLTSAQAQEMQAATTKQGNKVLWAFDNGYVYNFSKTLMQNIIEAKGQDYYEKLFSMKEPSLTFYATLKSNLTEIGKAQTKGLHVDSTTIEIISDPLEWADSIIFEMATQIEGPYSVIATLTRPVFAFNVQGLKTGNYYYFQSTAMESTSGEKGPPSDILAIRARPQRPASLSAVAMSKSAQIKWSKVQDSSGYAIYISSSRNGQYSLKAIVNGNSSLSYTVKNLSRQPYFFKVVSFKQVGSYKVPSVFTGVVTATPY